MACGTPVTCSNASSLPEVVGDAALLFDPRNVDAIAGALTRMLEDAVLRDDLRRRGALQASRFSWDRTARETLDVYRRLGR
jgi:alpha-1,3-rhamnosyl/mannosyltransferase